MGRRFSLSNAYISSALFCGGNPKLAASEAGRTTARMVLETYDSFIDPANWPGEEKRERLAQIFLWNGDQVAGGSATHALREPR